MNQEGGGLIYAAIVIIWVIFYLISWLTKQAKENEGNQDGEGYDIPEQFLIKERAENYSENISSKKEEEFLFKESKARKTQRKKLEPELEVASQEKVRALKKDSFQNFGRKPNKSSQNILKNIKKKSPLKAAMIFNQILQPPPYA